MNECQIASFGSVPQFIRNRALLQRIGQVMSFEPIPDTDLKNNWIITGRIIESLVIIYVFALVVAFQTLHESIC